ncbi:hypothetical protein NSS79_25925 [Paenibacillus sp. FSL L8-0436]|uniref:hypothetical protein n=1 Tax=Paenibacillus sp. FSL L8-0436 TaxID=2954686 RepID=UPI003158D9AB
MNINRTEDLAKILRKQPSKIIIGEVRGEEVAKLVGMQTYKPTQVSYMTNIPQKGIKFVGFPLSMKEII